MVTATIDPGRLLGNLDTLAGYTSTPGSGVTRLAWSEPWRAAVACLERWGAAAGAAVVMDAVGNVIAELPGADMAAPALVTGSHLDTVPSGGRLDGSYGVVAAWEVLAALQDAGMQLRHPVRAAAFVNEEGIVLPPFTGSRAVAGLIDDEELAALAPVLEQAGLPSMPASIQGWDRVAATVELHIEQGPVLDAESIPIGVVTAVTGQQRGTVVITGRTNHAGTTPMAMRRDALVPAAELVMEVEKLAGPGGCEVATVGRLVLDPGAPNVVPGRVEMSFDLRSVDDRLVLGALAKLRLAAADIARARGVEIAVVAQPATPAVVMDSFVRNTIEAAASAHGLSTRPIPSGAGHDCAIMSALGPVGMIFVPSMEGVSHHESEATPDDALVKGAALLLDTLVALDAADHG